MEKIQRLVPVDLLGHTSNENHIPGFFEGAEVTDYFHEGRYLMTTVDDYKLSASCIRCGGSMYLQYYPDEYVARPSTSCALTKGFSTVTEVSFPSGKILVADSIHGFEVDLDCDVKGRSYSEWLADIKAGKESGRWMGKYASYNSKLGQSQAIKAYAEVGMAYGPTGNQGLGLFKISDHHYQVIAPGYDEKTDEEPPTPGHEVASICTDLWAYSIVDFEEWKARGGDPDELGWTETVVDIIPGRYRFYYHGHEDGFDANGPENAVFCDMELIEKFS